MAEGTVTGRKLTKKGTPVVIIDGKDFYAGNTDVAGITVGDKIAYTATSFADGKLWGLDKGWRLLQAASKYPPSVPPSTQNAASVAPSTPQGGITEPERIFAYGVVTESIKAGLIREPEQIEKWVCAAKNALRSQGE